MRHAISIAALAAAQILASAWAKADVTISNQPTQNMTCANGVCTPTATNAVLNVSDLETLLASGSAEVTTTGSGSVQASNIDVERALSWSTSNALALEAYQGIKVNQEIAVAGLGGMSLVAGTLSFGRKGHIQFDNLSSQLTINGTAYTLVGDIKSLANAIASDPSGFYALANDYDATADGTYTASPIQTKFTGTLEGLGNSIKHLSVDASGYVGLFAIEYGTIRDLGVLSAKIRAEGGAIAGILAAEGQYLVNDTVSGSLSGEGGIFGGLTALGNIMYCSADVTITDSQSSGTVGGLTGLVVEIDQSYSVGSVRAQGGGATNIGGLAGLNTEGVIEDSYATGAVTGGTASKVGGLIGQNSEVNNVGALIWTSYSTGAVSAGHHSIVGGFAGKVYRPSGRFNRSDYWDINTSGTSEGTGHGNKRGIAGLTTQQLQSGLPTGFDPKIWAENPKINNGFPYLIANPPRE